MGVEAYLAACEPKASSWLGPGASGLFASGSAAEREGGKKANEFDEALMRWHYGSDHPRVIEAVRARLLALVSTVAVESGQRCRHGTLQALVGVAMAELWQGRQRWTHEERRLLFAEIMREQPICHSGWRKTWAPRYEALYREALAGIGRAERVAGRREGSC